MVYIQRAHTTQHQKKKKKMQPAQKLGRRSKQKFFKDDIQMAKRHIKCAVCMNAC